MIFILFSSTIISFIIIPQQQNIKEKRAELQDIKKEIDELEAEIKRVTRSEKLNLELIQKINRQIFLTNKIINSYREEERIKGLEIAALEKKISELQSETEKLKTNYSRFVVAIYKGIYQSEWAYLLDAESIQQALLRYKYLQEFSRQRKVELQQINLNRETLIVSKSKLEDEKKIKNDLITQKVREENMLDEQVVDKRKVLTQVRRDKTAIQRDLDAKIRAEKEIRNLIGRLVAKEEERKKAELARREEERKKNEEIRKKQTTKNEKPREPEKEIKVETFPTNEELVTKNFRSFSALRGRLNWPVARGTIIRKFGENKNLRLRTVTINYGIDIRVSGDLTVKSVADGVVSAIEWLPGYGSVLIITHKDQFRTVYGHLGEISVREGATILQGETIGKIGESLEGNILHFEIWNDRDNQNPEVWLVKR